MYLHSGNKQKEKKRVGPVSKNLLPVPFFLLKPYTYYLFFEKYIFILSFLPLWVWVGKSQGFDAPSFGFLGHLYRIVRLEGGGK